MTIFGLASVRGQIEPCGCTTNPLGDIARTAQLVEDARAAGPTLVVDAGSLSFTAPHPPAERLAQEDLKADLLADIYGSQLKASGVGIGPYDLAEGRDKVRPARLGEPTVVNAGGAKIGLFAAASKDHVPDASDPTETAKQALATFATQKADAVVALLSMSRREAKDVIAAVPGIDFVILDLGLEAPEPDAISDKAEKVKDTWLVVPANRGQVVSKLTLTLRGGDVFADAVGPAAAKALGETMDTQIAAAQQELDGFKADPTADPAFVAQKQQELDDLKAQRKKLDDAPMQAPAAGDYFTLEQVRVDRALACDADVEAAKRAYDKAAGDANVAAAKAKGPPAPPPAGKATFVGEEACADCHDDEATFWEGTHHAQAWDTLVKVGKQFDYDCIGCHVTGYGEAGGSSMGNNESLRAVQCETCHGPGSLHVAAKDKAGYKATIRLSPPDDLCANSCHTKEHSDTFQLEPYLRDLVGKGHGEARRKKLGDGPTGHELRQAGLAKAAQTTGARCTR